MSKDKEVQRILLVDDERDICRQSECFNWCLMNSESIFKKVVHAGSAEGAADQADII